MPIPSSYSLSLQSLDGLEDMDHAETTATIEPSVLTLEVVSGLPFRRLWNCTIFTYNCPESSIMNVAELSELIMQYTKHVCKVMVCHDNVKYYYHMPTSYS